VTRIDEAKGLAAWLAQHTAGTGVRLVLSLSSGTQPLRTAVQGHTDVTLLSGPEGGLTPAEEALALAAGFVPVTLGPRVLRAETAPLAVLAALTLD
jgi:16S rRNA (uracil1498-N3)-methyltransferase